MTDSTARREGRAIFTECGRMPGTLTPPTIPPADFHQIMEFCGTGVQVDEERHLVRTARQYSRTSAKDRSKTA